MSLTCSGHTSPLLHPAQPFVLTVSILGRRHPRRHPHWPEVWWHWFRLNGLMGGWWLLELIGGLVRWMVQGQCCCLTRECEQDPDDLDHVQLRVGIWDG